MIGIEFIKSIKDQRIIEARKLISVAGRKEVHKCLLEGYDCIQFALKEKVAVECVFCSLDASTDYFLTSLAERNIPCLAVSEGILKKISHTNYLIPYIGVAPVASLNLQDVQGEAVIMLNQVENHERLGAIILSAYLAGIKNIITFAPHFDLFLRKIVAASHYTVFGCKVENGYSQERIFRQLQAMHYQIRYFSAGADLLFSPSWQNQPLALFFE